MKGVILAGGYATRLFPLTTYLNKHLLPIFDKPMIFYPIETLVHSGIKELLIIVSGPHAGSFLPILKNGKDFGLTHLEYAFQNTANGGIADALSLAEDFAKNESIAVILGDNTTDANISKEINSFRSGAHIFLKEVSDARRFGVAELLNDRIVNIVEKPVKPVSNLAVTGLYLYDNKVFDYIKQCVPSARGELEISEINNFYITDNNLSYSMLEGFWQDAGTFENLFLANKYWAKKAGIE